MSLGEVILDRPDLKIIVVLIDLGTHLHLLDGLVLLFFLRVLVSFLLLKAVFPIIEDPADRRICLWRHLHQIEILLIRKPQCLRNGNDAQLVSPVIDQENLARPDLLVDAWLVVFVNGIGTANG